MKDINDYFYKHVKYDVKEKGHPEITGVILPLTNTRFYTMFGIREGEVDDNLITRGSTDYLSLVKGHPPNEVIRKAIRWIFNFKLER